MQTNGVQNARLIKVIETKSVIGKGTLEEPLKLLIQYWDLDGNILAEKNQDEDANEIYEFLLR